MSSAALVDAMPYATPTPYPTYAWSTATSPWWTEPPSAWPLTYAPNVAAETAAYSPYLAPQFQGLLSATVSGQAAMPTSSPSHSVVTCKASTTSAVAAAAAAAAALPQVGGGKFPSTRSNCECPNCQETERLGECFCHPLPFVSLLMYTSSDLSKRMNALTKAANNSGKVALMVTKIYNYLWIIPRDISKYLLQT